MLRLPKSDISEFTDSLGYSYFCVSLRGILSCADAGGLWLPKIAMPVSLKFPVSRLYLAEGGLATYGYYTNCF